MHTLIKPKMLKPGDTVACISTSSGLAHRYPYRYEIGKKQLSDAFDVRVIDTPNALRSHENLWQNPKLRADDLMWAFKNPDVDAIFAIIGGDDCIRLLPYIDYDVIHQNPKIFMGYSDSTSVHLMCYKAGLSSIYGPTILSGFAENGGILPYLKNSVKKTLFESNPIGDILPNLDGWTIQELDWNNPDNQNIKRKMNPATGYHVLQGEKTCRGHLLGGCLEVLLMTLGTPIFPKLEMWKGAILFLETSEDRPDPSVLFYLMRSLLMQGILGQLSGMIMGRPKDEMNLLHQYDAVIQQTLSESDRSDMPVLTQMDFGHTEPQFCIPYGATAEIDPILKTFKILQSAVQP